MELIQKIVNMKLQPRTFILLRLLSQVYLPGSKLQYFFCKREQDCSILTHFDGYDESTKPEVQESALQMVYDSESLYFQQFYFIYDLAVFCLSALWLFTSHTTIMKLLIFLFAYSKQMLSMTYPGYCGMREYSNTNELSLQLVVPSHSDQSLVIVNLKSHLSHPNPTTTPQHPLSGLMPVYDPSGLAQAAESWLN